MGNITSIFRGHDRDKLRFTNFEARFLQRLEAVVEALPAGSAELAISKQQGGNKFPFPHFRINPSNPRSAKIEGFFVEEECINFTLGVATWVELFVSSTSQMQQDKQIDRFLEICHLLFSNEST